jgi:hypothetical protein
MRKSIEWEPYRSPLETEDATLEINEDNNENDMPYKDKYDEIDEDNMQPVGIQHPGKWMYTHFGMLPLPSSEMIGRAFNAWTMITNFNITDDIIRILEKIDGVEAVCVFSRYRAIVCFGTHKSFQPEEIKKLIDKTLCEDVNEKADINKIATSVILLKNKFIENNVKNWFIFVLPNGEVVSYNTNDEDSKYKKRLRFYKNLNKKVNGLFYEAETNDNDNKDTTKG